MCWGSEYASFLLGSVFRFLVVVVFFKTVSSFVTDPIFLCGSGAFIEFSSSILVFSVEVLVLIPVSIGSRAVFFLIRVLAIPDSRGSSFYRFQSF